MEATLLEGNHGWNIALRGGPFDSMEYTFYSDPGNYIEFAKCEYSNETIAQMIKDGTWEKAKKPKYIVHKYFVDDEIVDGRTICIYAGIAGGPATIEKEGE